MAVEVLLGGVVTSNVKNFSVQEDATPIDPANSSGGVGRISFGLNETANTVLALGATALVDGTRGKTSGYVRSISFKNGDATISADSVLGLFNTERTVQPYVGTLGGAIQHYCDVVGITNDVVVEASVTGRSVIYPGWRGNAWVYMKQLLAKEQVEMALVFDRIYVRPLRLLTATLDRSLDFGGDIDNSTAARAIEIYYYNHTYGTQMELYPLTTEEPTIYSVDAAQTQVFTIQLNASVSSINQPVVQDFVNDESYAGSNGVYAVTGNDNLPITAAQWTAQGGSLTVQVTDDPSIIEVTLVGASMPDYSPYRIAMSSGAGNDYNALHITGTAVTWDKQLVTIPTGAVDVTTSDAVGVTVDSPFISTRAEAYSLGLKTAQAYAGLSYTINGTALDINRSGDGAGLVQATVADFNDAVAPGTTVAAFNVTWAGQDIADFNAYWQGTVDGIFANQLFGNAPGARVLLPDANFRVVTVTTTEDSVQYTATLDTLVSDFNAAWSGQTVADFNVAMSGRSLRQFSTIPLRSS